MNVDVLLIFQHQCLPLIYIQDYGDQLLSKERTMIIIYRSYLKVCFRYFYFTFSKTTFNQTLYFIDDNRCIRKNIYRVAHIDIKISATY